MSGTGQATASIPPSYSAGGSRAPLVPCVYTDIQLSLVGTGVIEDRRPFTTAAGESFLQFAPAPPITTTADSGGYVLLNGGWSGNVSGDITGDFAAPNLNGLAITGSTVSQEG